MPPFPPPSTILAGVLLLAPAGSVRADEPVLVAGTPRSAALRGGDVHVYTLDVEAGRYLRLAADQRGIDVVLTLDGPRGRLRQARNGEGPSGPEWLSLITPETGRYRIEVAPARPDAPEGRYELAIEELRVPGPEDTERVAAETAFAEVQQADRPEAPARREAVERLSGLVPVWQRLGDVRLEAETIILRGALRHGLGERTAAREDFERALALFRSAGDRRGEARALNNLASALNALGEKQAALGYYAQALPVMEELGDLRMQAVVLNNMGTVHKDLGELRQALERYAESLPLRRATGDARGEALVLMNMGVAHRLSGSAQQALETYRQALDRAEGDPLLEANTLHNLASAYVAVGQPERALVHLRRALGIAGALADRNLESGVLTVIGSALHALGRFEEAAEPLTRAREIRRGMGDTYGEAVALVRLCDVHRALGRLEHAERCFGEALERQREVGDRYGEARALSDLGRMREAQGRPQEARIHHEQALALARSIGDVSGEAGLLHRLAVLDAAAGDVPGARARIQSSLALYESLRAQLAGQVSRAAYFASVQEAYELDVELLMRLHRAEPAAGHDARALEASERRRARSLLEVLEQGGLARQVEPWLLEREQSVRDRLNVAADRQARLQRTRATPDQVLAMRRQVEALVAEYQDVQAKLRAGAESLDPVVLAQPAPATEIQGLLDEETLLVEFSLGAGRSFAWVVGRDSLAAVELAPRSVIEEAARAVHAALAGPDDARFEAAARRAAELVLAPLAHLLARKRIAFVPDGALHYLPFAALPLPPRGSQAPLALVDRHEVALLPSASVLAALRRRPPRPDAAGAVAVIADPVFEADDPRLGRRTTGPQGPETRTAAALRAAGLDPKAIRRLPFSRREAREIAAVAPAGTTLLALDFEASRETALRSDLSRFRALHFATHGVVDDAHPELSGIVLSLVDARGRPRDGFLRLHDIARLDLPVDLVVLSGCRTGLGKEVRGEGILGLARGFMQAGARRVLATLAQVDDRATAALMRRFYASLLGDGLPPAAALRTAQQAMRADPRWRRPLYWAAFAVHGDWR